jgi:hypothetical protein
MQLVLSGINRISDSDDRDIVTHDCEEMRMGGVLRIFSRQDIGTFSATH